MIEAMMLLLLLQGTNSAPAASRPDMSTKAAVEAEAKVFFSSIDSNKDGKVERAEADAFHKRMVSLSDNLRREAGTTFAQLDANKDGMLTRQEYLAIVGTPPPANEQWLKANDANGDGRVELSEAIKRVQITFDALDRDKDGKLSAAEKAAARGGQASRP